MSDDEVAHLHTTGHQDNQVSHKHTTSGEVNLLDDKIRVFLVGWTALLTLVVFLTYLITRDRGVLLGSTVVGIAVCLVFTYYFKRRDK